MTVPPTLPPAPATNTVEARLSRPASKAGRLQRAALAILVEHEADDALPTSGRFVFYELEQRQQVADQLRRGITVIPVGQAHLDRPQHQGGEAG